MNTKSIFLTARRLMALALVMLLVLAVPMSAEAAAFREIFAEHNGAQFTYELFLTDQNGAAVTNPRKLKAGDTLNVEIRLTREDYNEPGYQGYGIEFRLMTRGLRYNNDGVSLRKGTPVYRASYIDGDSVGFAWYDMTRAGENFNNPVSAGHWSYTVEDPSQVNITVPVALIYITGEDDVFVPVGMAQLYLDVNGGELIGEDVSGEYPSGTAVILPDARFGDYVFDGWSDGVRVYPAGTEYVVTGIVTLTAQWSGLVRDRYVAFIYDGGELIGEDPTGFYADGEVIIMPEAIREGYRFLGWSDGVNVYPAGSEYVVTNTVNLIAQWEAIPDEAENEISIGKLMAGGIAAALLGWLWWLLLLWKRKNVKYSLITGDVSLDFKNGDVPAEVSVVLYDGEKEYHLNKSGSVEVKHRLKFIKNVTHIPVAVIEPGTYKGKLLIHEGNKIRVRKCRIKALDKELKEK